MRSLWLAVILVDSRGCGRLWEADRVSRNQPTSKEGHILFLTQQLLVVFNTFPGWFNSQRRRVYEDELLFFGSKTNFETYSTFSAIHSFNGNNSSCVLNPSNVPRALYCLGHGKALNMRPFGGEGVSTSIFRWSRLACHFFQSPGTEGELVLNSALHTILYMYCVCVCVFSRLNHF